MIGPSDILGMPDIIWITVVGFAITGLASPFSIIPPYKEIENCLEIYEDKKFDPEKV